MIDWPKLQGTLVAVLSLLLIVTGATVVGKAKKQDYAETARVGFNVVIGIVIASLGLIGLSFGVFGKQILDFFGVKVG